MTNKYTSLFLYVQWLRRHKELWRIKSDHIFEFHLSIYQWPLISSNLVKTPILSTDVEYQHNIQFVSLQYTLRVLLHELLILVMYRRLRKVTEFYGPKQPLLTIASFFLGEMSWSCKYSCMTMGSSTYPHLRVFRTFLIAN
jgi:hypothetical protein